MLKFQTTQSQHQRQSELGGGITPDLFGDYLSSSKSKLSQSFLSQ